MDAAKTTGKKRKVDVKKLVILAMLTGIAYVVMLVSKLMPSVNGFLDFDFKDVVICIGGFIYGPVSAAAMSLVVSFIEMVTVSHTGIWGFLMNFLATASFCCTACYIYKKHHTMKGAVLGLATGVVALVVVMLLWNYLVTPIYQGVKRKVIVEMLLPVFLPFNAVKGGMNLAATLLLYKPVVTALRKAKLIPASESATPPVLGKKRIGSYLVSLFVLVTFVLLALALANVI